MKLVGIEVAVSGSSQLSNVTLKPAFFHQQLPLKIVFRARCADLWGLKLNVAWRFEG